MAASRPQWVAVSAGSAGLAIASAVQQGPDSRGIDLPHGDQLQVRLCEQQPHIQIGSEAEPGTRKMRNESFEF